jgi:hypothetical protein
MGQFSVKILPPEGQFSVALNTLPQVSLYEPVISLNAQSHPNALGHEPHKSLI